MYHHNSLITTLIWLYCHTEESIIWWLVTYQGCSVTEKDSLHSAEVRKMNSALFEKQTAIESLHGELVSLRSQLSEREEALEAAQRLSLQLERKEAALTALKEEGIKHPALTLSQLSLILTFVFCLLHFHCMKTPSVYSVLTLLYM